MSEMHAVDLDIHPSKAAELVDEAWFWKGNTGISRPYLGISIIAHPCARYLWLNFRWFSYDLQEGRMLRLFRRGQREEETVVHDLQDAGMLVEFVLSAQLDIDFGCHVKGHPDGLIAEGVPEAPKAMHSLEIKTHNLKSFTELLEKGVRLAKPMHYAQMQCEMLGTSMKLDRKVDRALYVAVCKDDDRMYTERVHLDRPYAEGLIKRGQDIAISDYIPIPISARPDWYQCRLCRFHGFCHPSEGKRLLPDVNCRTCLHFTAEKVGTCTCACYGGKVIPEDAQRRACRCHAFHPDMVSDWNLISERSTKDSAMYRIQGIGDVLNGWEGYASQDIRNAAEGGGDADLKGIPEEGSSISF